MMRKEPKYSLEDDEKPYRAKAMCRCGRPKLAMVFASALRPLRLLQRTRMVFDGKMGGSQFKKDLNITAEASAVDCARARAVLPAEGSVVITFATPAVRENSAALTALRHLLTSTATVPLTGGHALATLHFGFALSRTISGHSRCFTR